MPNLLCCANTFLSYDSRAAVALLQEWLPGVCSEAQTNCRDAGAAARCDWGAGGLQAGVGVTCLLASHQRAVLASSPFAPSVFVLGLCRLWEWEKAGGWRALRPLGWGERYGISPGAGALGVVALCLRWCDQDVALD
eukprot:scaffold41281_cov57-Phaeocystis_antarctica.AAC.2